MAEKGGHWVKSAGGGMAFVQAGGGGTSLGIYGEGEGTPSEKQIAYANSLRGPGGWAETQMASSDEGRAVLGANVITESAGIYMRSLPRPAQLSATRALYAKAQKWMSSVDPAKMTRTGISKFIDAAKQSTLATWRGSLPAGSFEKQLGSYLPKGYRVVARQWGRNTQWHVRSADD